MLIWWITIIYLVVLAATTLVYGRLTPRQAVTIGVFWPLRTLKWFLIELFKVVFKGWK